MSPLIGSGVKVTATGALALALLAVTAGSRAAGLVDSDLGVSVAGTPAKATVGQTVSFTASVTANGPDQASGVSLTVTLSGAHGSVSNVSSPVAGSHCTIAQTRRSARCLVGSLAVGASGQMTVTVVTAGQGTITATARSREQQYDPISANSQAFADAYVAGTSPPVVSPVYGAAFDQPFAAHPQIFVRWSATAAGSGIARYDVRYRSASLSTDFGPFVTWLAATRKQTATFAGKPGTTYCFSVRATDFDGNVSPWADERCTSVLLPTVDLQHTSSWRKSGEKGGLRTRVTGATLTVGSVLARRLVLAAVVGPGYGTLRVAWNGRLLRTIDLESRSRARQLLPLADLGAARRGTLVLTVLSSRRTVAVDGLGVEKG